MIAQLVYLSTDLENRDMLLAEALSNARESLRESGVVRFDVLQHSENPDQIVLFEVYENAEALEAHRNTDHFKRWQEKGVPLLSKPRERALYNFVK